MHFEADLDIFVDGVGAHVRSDGSALIIESAEPAALIGNLRRAAGGRRRVALVADGLAATGASVHVDGPRGRLVTVGADANSRAGGLLTGTRHLAPGWPAVVSSLASVSTRRRLAVGIASAIAIGVIVVRLV